MGMRKAFAFIGLVGMLLVALGAFVLVDSYLRISEVAELQRVASRVGSAGFRLALLTNDQLLHAEVRSERQWRDTEADLRTYMAGHEKVLAPYQREIDKIRTQLGHMVKLFDTIEARREKAREKGRSVREDEVYSLLSSQMSIRITELQSAIDEFDAASGRATERVLGASVSGLMIKLSGLLAAYVLFGAGVWLFFYARVLRPLSLLGDTIDRIGTGQSALRARKVADDELGEVVDSFNDLLDRQQAAERSLEASSHLLRQANAELEQFAYVASHDLKAPLRGVANLAEWIEEDMPGGVPDEVREHLDLLKSRVRRMEGLLEGLLQYSRIGRREYPVETVDTGAMVHELVDLLSPPEGFEVSVAPGMPLVSTQRPPLEMVFRNLINNAIKHHDRPEGRIEISAAEEGRFVAFTVVDDGPGISPEYHEKVFVMFQTLKPRDEVEGSGMGLALVRRAVENQGGTVRLESDPGSRGTRFRFTWPKAAASS